jgi:hypothetical protein
MSDSGVGKEFIGFAYNKTTATESTNKADYKWSEYTGEKGDKGDTGAKGDKGATGSQGAQGPAGAAGKEGTSYLYAYYANNSIGTAPTKPGTGETISGGWSASPNKGSYQYVWVSQCVKTNGVWSAWSAPTSYIVPGEDGARQAKQGRRWCSVVVRCGIKTKVPP